MSKFPNMRGKYKLDPLFSPEEALDHFQDEYNFSEGKIPESVILCYDSDLMDYVGENYDFWELDLHDEFYVLEDYETGILGDFGVGAPAAGTLIEELVELDVVNFLSYGLAGSLDPNLDTGEIVLCTKALRDEGTSHHYLGPSKYSHPSEDLTKRVRNSLLSRDMEFVEGPTWTIDAPYRETPEEVRKYRKEGIKTVEMEASAIFAVAEAKGVKAASFFVVSDHLAEDEWTPDFRRVRKNPKEIFEVALSSLET